MKKTDVLIIGAGASGLMAAYQLIKAGKTVTVLEARSRPGGRIHTLNNEQSFTHAELGAEFIHGNLPVTHSLLKEAGIGHSNASAEMWQYRNGKFKQDEEFVEGWDKLIDALNQLQEDLPLHDFLHQKFPGGEYAAMRAQAENYVSGYDTADARDASAFALRREWNNEDEDAQSRVDGGYIAMIEYLAGECRKTGNEILPDSIVKEINWQTNEVTAVTTTGNSYEAGKVIIAMPLGVLQAQKESEGAIVFQPQLNEHTGAFQDIGFGSVIKILLEFDEVFWESDAVTKRVGADLADMGYLFTGEAIPTYWTQAPAHKQLLTGWLGGPPAYAKKDMPDAALLQLALTSLAHVFKTSAEALQGKLVAWHVANWTAELFTRGSYAYDKVRTPEARKLLQQPVENTIYFAGEYLYDGPAMGTVEAALTSGKKAAEMILGKK